MKTANLRKIEQQLLTQFDNSINSIEIKYGYIYFKWGNQRMWAKLTKTGIMKKNSARIEIDD